MPNPDPRIADPLSADPRSEPNPRPRIRSYTLRQSHFSTAQRDAIDRLMPHMGIAPTDEPIDPREVFGRDAPCVVEIGFGMGQATAQVAQANPAVDFIAIDVHLPGVGALLQRIESMGLKNLRVLVQDGAHTLETRLAPGSLAGVHLWFPDPWPKARHAKRRLFNARFADAAARSVQPHGYLHVATDWSPYAVQMARVLAADPVWLRGEDADSAAAFRLAALPLAPDESLTAPFRLRAATAPGGDREHLDAERREADAQAASLADPRPPWRPHTRFEIRGSNLGHTAFDFVRWRAAR